MDAAMIKTLYKRPVWIYTKTVDFRKQVDGLVDIISQELGRKAEKEGLYLFRNRKQDKLKLIVWDRNGFVMGYKRLERGKFYFPVNDDTVIKIDMKTLGMLVSGMPIIEGGSGKKARVIYG